MAHSALWPAMAGTTCPSVLSDLNLACSTGASAVQQGLPGLYWFQQANWLLNRTRSLAKTI
jgi:hypothetical protein